MSLIPIDSMMIDTDLFRICIRKISRRTSTDIEKKLMEALDAKGVKRKKIMPLLRRSARLNTKVMFDRMIEADAFQVCWESVRCGCFSDPELAETTQRIIPLCILRSGRRINLIIGYAFDDEDAETLENSISLTAALTELVKDASVRNLGEEITSVRLVELSYSAAQAELLVESASTERISWLGLGFLLYLGGGHLVIDSEPFAVEAEQAEPEAEGEARKELVTGDIEDLKGMEKTLAVIDENKDPGSSISLIPGANAEVEIQEPAALPESSTYRSEAKPKADKKFALLANLIQKEQAHITALIKLCEKK